MPLCGIYQRLLMILEIKSRLLRMTSGPHMIWSLVISLISFPTSILFPHCAPATLAFPLGCQARLQCRTFILVFLFAWNILLHIFHDCFAYFIKVSAQCYLLCQSSLIALSKIPSPFFLSLLPMCLH